MGWYSTGNLLPNAGEEVVARQINELNEASLFLKVDPFKSDRSTNELPMVLFELEPDKSLNWEKQDSWILGINYKRY